MSKKATRHIKVYRTPDQDYLIMNTKTQKFWWVFECDAWVINRIRTGSGRCITGNMRAIIKRELKEPRTRLVVVG